MHAGAGSSVHTLSDQAQQEQQPPLQCNPLYETPSAIPAPCKLTSSGSNTAAAEGQAKGQRIVGNQGQLSSIPSQAPQLAACDLKRLSLGPLPDEGQQCDGDSQLDQADLMFEPQVCCWVCFSLCLSCARVMPWLLQQQLRHYLVHK